uniref:DNA2/NAM7 helicase-like C-terminal domain-containing protein n=1 Tax=Chromera velia CCMP2878 TaxID=1169474 RepID=A0A0G4FVS3_9ALVE|eukprot:Cvel_3771.t1-p1 / transcript=Cvel_3771.t1 / gene=Cvel_3771 / organism=Chromera_velia_CCMP2878 / gene_product=DNA polymerase alpha-associated DNA helicase A, putative / transcript_product=DNA polymerase alpha-associated DNA helicase A, putative / location=Cvel_scaffold158:30837-31889(-) / protein_length=320 / sequence_SO=supercontig / SO=protein_coding / is_pseudo=false
MGYDPEGYLFLGDPDQLCPHVQGKGAAKGGMRRSLMQRFLSVGVSQARLFLQYRYKEPIADCLRLLHYGSELLQDAPAVCNRPGLSNLQACPHVFFFATDGEEKEKEEGGTPSGSNEEEAEIAVSAVERLVAMMPKEDPKQSDKERSKAAKHPATVDASGCRLWGLKDITVLTGYASQKALIRRKLNEKGLHDVAVENVDSFQGQQSEIVVFTNVRAAPESVIEEYTKAPTTARREEMSRDAVGSSTNLARLIVALSRAKEHLILIGNAHTLRVFGSLLAIILNHALRIPGHGVPRGVGAGQRGSRGSGGRSECHPDRHS